MFEDERRSNLNTEGTQEDSTNREEGTVNWTTPSGMEQRRRDNASDMQRQEMSQGGYRQSYGQIPGGSRGSHTEAPDRNQERKGSKNSWVKKAAGITAAAVLFGTVSGGVMTGVSLVGARMTGLADIQAAGAQAAETQARIPTVDTQTAPSSGQTATPVSTTTDVSAIAEAAMPSIVAINDTLTVQQRDFFGRTQTYEAQSSGSGIIVGQNDSELLVATNNHVVEGANELKVTFVDGNDVDAAIKGTDSASDLAIIAVQLADIPSDTMSKIKVASMGDSDELKVGQQVIAIGNALGYGQSVTVGYISALDREIQDENGISRTFIQTDAAINPGNSGGALLDINGNVIGINAAKTASTEVEGMGFAIPISKAQEILSNLMTLKTKIAVAEEAQGYLGIQGTNIDANASREFGMPVGIYVYKILEEGAAANSGLKEKDIITKFDGQSVTNMEELKRMLTFYEGGSTVTLTVQSLVDGAYVEHEVEITLGTKPMETQQQ